MLRAACGGKNDVLPAGRSYVLIVWNKVDES